MAVRDHRARTAPFQNPGDLRAWVDASAAFSWAGDDIGNGELGFDAVEDVFDAPALRHFLIDLKYKIGSVTVGEEEIDLSHARDSSWLYDDERADTWNHLSRLLALGQLETGLEEAGVDLGGIDGVAGIPTGGRFLSETIAHLYGFRSCYVKERSKDYGSGQLSQGDVRGRIEGQPFDDGAGLGMDGETWMVVDDVTTTGKSVADAIKALESDDVGADVTHVALLCSREDIALRPDYDDPVTFLQDRYDVTVVIAGYTGTELVNIGHQLGHVSDRQYRQWAETAEVDAAELRLEP